MTLRIHGAESAQEENTLLPGVLPVLLHLHLSY